MRLLRRLVERHPVLLSVWEAVGIGLGGIRAYKMRAGLTVLGVVMGIMTVTGMSSIVAGLNASMAQQIEGLGSATVFVRPWQPGENISRTERRRRKGLTDDEVRALRRLSALSAVAPVELVRTDMIKYGRHQLQSAQVVGTTPDYETVHENYIGRGRFLTETDVSRSAHVAVIGTDVVDALFPHMDPVGKDLNIDGRRFEVVGVLERQGRFLGQSRDNLVLVPLESLPRSDVFDFLLANVRPASTTSVNEAADQVRELLRRRRKLRYLDKDNFAVFTQDTLTDLYRQITGGIYFVMIAISSIGLVVGGVGVMNIMLVSVTERTREIGVRKALGARKSDIRWQFLTEAMTLTGVGGILGIVVGGGIAWLVNAFSPFPAVVQPVWVVAAFATSMAVGLAFGLWPAAKAAGLDPIEALRYE